MMYFSLPNTQEGREAIRSLDTFTNYKVNVREYDCLLFVRLTEEYCGFIDCYENPSLVIIRKNAPEKSIALSLNVFDAIYEL